MDKTEIITYLEEKGKEISKWLKENFNPYITVIITDTKVEIIRTELHIPTT